MSTLTVNYISSCRLPCSCSLTSSGPIVVVCVPASKLATVSGVAVGSFEAQILSVVPISVTGTCGGCNFNYNLSYDSSVLASGQTIGTSDITGVFCKDCLTTWVENKIDEASAAIGEDCIVRNNACGSQTFVNQVGDEFDLFRGDPRRVYSSCFPGSDLGTQINAADTFLGTADGEIIVDRISSTSITTPVVITNGHTLRFVVGGPYICTAGFTFHQGGSLIGHGGVADYSSVSTGTVLVHNFNGDFITYSGASPSLGSQGGGTIENLTLWNSYAGGDLSGNAIVLTGSTTNLRTDWVKLHRVYTDGSNAAFRWTRSLVIDGSPVGGSNGIRNFYVDSCRFASSGTDSQDVLINNVFNVFFSNMQINNGANGGQLIGATITGSSGNISSNLMFSSCDIGNLVHDWANNVSFMGGALSSLTVSANALGVNMYFPARIVGSIANASANTTIWTTTGAQWKTVVPTVPTTSGGTANEFLKINVNGNDRLIPLNLP